MTEHLPGSDADRAVRRRDLLGIAGVYVAAHTAGCTGVLSNDQEAACDEEATRDLDGPVPEKYRHATSQLDIQREPESLLSKADANYQHEPNDGDQCSSCGFFIPPEEGDCLGSCARVEGLIEPWGWCESYRWEAGEQW